MEFNYKQEAAKYELHKILSSLINHSIYEKWLLKISLKQIINVKKGFEQVILDFYDLCCNGYDFLDNLGLGYALRLANCEYENKTFQILFNELYPEIKKEAKNFYLFDLMFLCMLFFCSLGVLL